MFRFFSLIMRKDLRDIFDQIKSINSLTNRPNNDHNSQNNNYNNNSANLLVPRLASDQLQSELKLSYFAYINTKNKT